MTVYAASALEAALPGADVIYVCAGATDVPSVLLDALSIVGRLVLPLTPTEGPGFMLLVTRRSSAAYDARHLSPAFFIPCTGARDERQSVQLTAALRAQSPDDIRSLRRGGNLDATTWCVGSDWWLSTAAAHCGLCDDVAKAPGSFEA